eukprot:CAMPEP_0194206386 /NCGR_PEP_ID=MMETSP0156-20130528/5434_1 /TAXON_ID=33649 /ORGANISM="Thalassionema nitzschioides, Strain L26-B" /LENGTH=753 /DNA_ID=CAMNT_0038932905 /DNA_START=11 /DNA_END=2269 /DNA_ORIENTATION=+
MDFDETRLYYSHQSLRKRNDDEDANAINNDNEEQEENDGISPAVVRRHFREFLRNYRNGNQYYYRDKLTRLHRRQSEKLQIDLQHLGEYDPELLGLLRMHPTKYIPFMELASMDALKSILYENDRQQTVDGDSTNNNEDETAAAASTNESEIMSSSPIQLLFRGSLALTPLRKIQSQHINQLIKCPGIVISTQPVKSRATSLTIRCGRCLDEQRLSVEGGAFAGTHLPRRCSGPEGDQCGPFPYAVVPDESKFCDRQSWKVQEVPESVPTGEMPRSLLVAVERGLVDTAPPGTRVELMGIPTLLTTSADKNVQSVYLQVVGVERPKAPTVSLTPAEETAFAALAKHPKVYDILSRSMAPSLSGSYTVDIKKAILCLLLSGSRKKLPDGVRLRGDINVLLLGDPSTAKSQFLQFASRVAAPVGIYTSGKGSSAAGLTASVVKDKAGEFYLEGGAMVMADGGVVCIDEFDKMRPQDRVAIHEAMEQQTISIAKAGITTVLNARTSVLAAANPVFGRYDDLKSAEENIDLMTTILSRFDLIFLVRDTRDEERDIQICRHVMGVHMSKNNGSSSQQTDETSADIARLVQKIADTGEGELSIAALKKYIYYCRTRCQPRLDETSGEQLVSHYVQIRNSAGSKNSSIPITVRQLEALVRLSESLAKLRLDPQVQPEDVQEALRLFSVSTMVAASTQATSVQNDYGYTEQFLQLRLKKGQLVNRSRLLEEAAAQGHSAVVVAQALHAMVGRGEVQERHSG